MFDRKPAGFGVDLGGDSLMDRTATLPWAFGVLPKKRRGPSNDFNNHED